MATVEHINSSDRFSFYRRFKTVNGVEPYLLLDLNRQVRCALSRFRLGVAKRVMGGKKAVDNRFGVDLTL